MGMVSVSTVRLREYREAHGVRGGFPPKGGKPHHPHDRQPSKFLGLFRQLKGSLQ